MVLARGVHVDVLDEDHLLVADVERRVEHLARILAEPREGLGVGTRDASRSLAQSLAVGVLAHREEELAHRRLDAGGVEAGAHTSSLGSTIVGGGEVGGDEVVSPSPSGPVEASSTAPSVA